MLQALLQLFVDCRVTAIVDNCMLSQTLTLQLESD